MIKQKIFIITISLVLFFNCSKKITVKKFLDSLPSDKTDLYQTEDVYDNFLMNINTYVSTKQYLKGLDEILKYYKIFQADDDNRNIDYYLGVILKNYSTNSNFINYFKKLPDQEKLIFKFNKWRIIKDNYKYFNEHLISALKVKHNYFLSMKAAEILYPEKLVPVKNYINMKTNIAVLEYFNNYFPSSMIIYKLSQNSKYFPHKYMRYRKNNWHKRENVKVILIREG